MTEPQLLGGDSEGLRLGTDSPNGSLCRRRTGAFNEQFSLSRLGGMLGERVCDSVSVVRGAV